MLNVQRLAEILRLWPQIKENWDDSKSALIESSYLEPLACCTSLIGAKVDEIYDFIRSVEDMLK